MKSTIRRGSSPQLEQCARRVADDMEALREFDWMKPGRNRYGGLVLLLVTMLLLLAVGGFLLVR